jgi:uncharacterized protein DUF6318
MIGAVNRARAVLTALVLASALTLAGCTDDDPEPKFSPPSSEPPESPSTTAAVLELGPEETVRAWIEARNAAMETGDLSSVHALTADDCTSCDGILDPIADVYRDGGHFETDGWAVAGSQVKKKSSSAATVSTGLEFSGGRTVPKAGAEPVTYGPEKHIVLFRLRDAGEGWRVNFVGFIS